MTAPRSPRPAPMPADPEAAFDEALRAYPLSPTTPGPAPRERARARMPSARGQAARPRFRLSWLDFALSGLGGAMAGLLLLLRALATPEQLARAQNTLAVLLVAGGPQWAPALLAALALAGFVGIGLLLAASVALTIGRR